MTLHILSPLRHRNLYWRRFSAYTHAVDRHLVVLAAAEVRRAALSLPLAFVRDRDRWSLCAVLGLAPGQNLYVSQAGEWLGSYVPAVLRAHPFHLGWDNKSATLCIDEDSGLIDQEGSGEPLFDEGGNLSQPVSQVWSFLSATAESLLSLEEACKIISEAGIISPWSITVQGADGLHTVSGLNRIDEAALNALDGATFDRLRQVGMLSIIYAQLLSMGHLTDLGKLAQARAEAEAAERARAEVKPMIALPDDSTIDWDWSKVGKT